MDELSRCFLCCYPLNLLPLDDVLRDISWEDQSVLLDNTVNHPLVVKNPVNLSYQVSFMKKIIDHLTRNQIEIHDDIYISHCDLLQRLSVKRDFYYKHYNIADNITVSLKENSNLISDGTTGLRSWEASFVLSEWSIQNLECFENKNILELGSGAGLAGIVVAKMCNPGHVWMSDYHESVLNLMRENLELNFSNKKHTQIDILKLDWEEVEGFPAKLIKYPDIVIAADVVYDDSIFGALLKTFKFFLKAKNKCEIILVSTVRNPDTMKKFTALLENTGTMVTNVNLPVSKHFYWPPDAKFIIYNIRNNEFL